MFLNKKILIGTIILLFISQIIFYFSDQSKWVELIISDAFIILLFLIVSLMKKNTKSDDDIPTIDERVSYKIKHYNHMILLWSHIILLAYLGYKYFVEKSNIITINNLAFYLSSVIFIGFIFSGFLAKRSEK